MQNPSNWAGAAVDETLDSGTVQSSENPGPRQASNIVDFRAEKRHHARSGRNWLPSRTGSRRHFYSLGPDDLLFDPDPWVHSDFVNPADATLLISVGGLRLGKCYTLLPSGKIQSEHSERAATFAARAVRFGTLEDIHTLVAGDFGAPVYCLIRGAPLAHVDLERTRRRRLDRNGEPATMVDVPRAWVAIDFEAEAPEFLLPSLQDRGDCAEYVVSLLPAQFRGAGFVFAFSSSHLVGPENANKLRCRLFFLVNRPLLGAEVYNWLSEVKGADHAFWRPVQELYVAPPTFVDMDDPIADRYLLRDGPAVEVDEQAIRTASIRQRQATTAAHAAGLATRDYPATVSQVEGALGYCDAGDYETWLYVGMALKVTRLIADDGSETDVTAYDLWLDWSASSKKFPGADTCAEKWRSFSSVRQPNQLGIGFVFKEAERNGRPRQPRPFRAFKALLERDPEVEDLLRERDPTMLMLIEMNARFAMLSAGRDLGKVADLSNPAAPAVVSLSALTALFENRKIEIQIEEVGEDGDEPKIKTRRVNPVSRWRASKDRAEITGFAFEPQGSPVAVPAGAHNLWTGFAVKPENGSAHLPMLHHLRHMACDSEAEFRWLMTWLAALVQFPGRQLESAVCWRGDFGVGKTIIAEYMGAIFGEHSVKISKPEHVVGRFNSHLARAVLVRLEETFWGDDQRSASVLRDLITAGTQLLEMKGKDSFTVTSHVKLLATSNAAKAIPSAMRERRWAVFEVKPDHKGDDAYWAPIHASLRDGTGPANLLHQLLAWKVDFDLIRRPPRTMGRLAQVKRAFTPITQFWHEALVTGEIVTISENNVRGTLNPFATEAHRTTVKRTLYASYLEWHALYHPREPLPLDSLFWPELAAASGLGLAGNGKNTTRMAPSQDAKRSPAICIPTLEECRAAFAEAIEQPVADLFPPGDVVAG